MLGLLLALTCHADPLAQLDLREERAALRAADSAFAVRASQGLLPAFRDVLDEDVVFLNPGERLLFGKAATLAPAHGSGTLDRLLSSGLLRSVGIVVVSAILLAPRRSRSTGSSASPPEPGRGSACGS